MKIKTNILGILVLVVMFGGIWLTDYLGGWNTESSRNPALIKAGESAGKPDPADIRGSYTFNDISKAFGVPVADLAKAFNLPAQTDAAAFQVKGLEALYPAEEIDGKEIGSDTVRYFTALYSGLPFNVTGDIWMPNSAVNLLKQRGGLTTEQITYLEAHSVKITSGVPVNSDPAAEPVKAGTPANSGENASAMTVAGSTTFQQLLDWGLSRETIENIIGAPISDPTMKVKDFVTANGQEFSTYKQKLQIELDKLN